MNFIFVLQQLKERVLDCQELAAQLRRVQLLHLVHWLLDAFLAVDKTFNRIFLVSYASILLH